MWLTVLDIVVGLPTPDEMTDIITVMAKLPPLQKKATLTKHNQIYTDSDDYCIL
ncbi:hypothetical protein DSUL_100009 [Desulfovibrionales bacterium]